MWKMKKLKRLFFVPVGLIMAFCLAIIVCALNPSLTRMLAQRVQTLQQDAAPEEVSVSDTEQGRGEGVLPEAIPGINVNWMPNRETEGYLIPANMPENLPAEVTGLWGYEPVSADTVLVEQEEADILSDILAGAETEEWPFNDDYFPYYLMLESDLKPLYRQIYTNAIAQVTSFVPAVDVSLEELNTVFEAVFNDHPELVLLETGYSCMYLEDGTCVEITLEYNDLIDNEPGRIDYVNKCMELLQEADALGSDIEKEKYIHDALAEMAAYDMNAPYNQVAYSAIENGRTVCAGYARAFQMLMIELGIPCYYCTGYAGEAHAWNIVLLDGKYYNVDLTWDDTDPMTYDYFNKTDAEFADTHIRTGLSVYLPACTGTLYGGDPAEVIAAQSADSSGDAVSGSDNVSDSDGTSGSEDSLGGGLINPNPQKPLVWEDRGKSDGEGLGGDKSELSAEDIKRLENLQKAGITEEEVLDTLSEYYDDCKAQMKRVGVGDKHFSNVVPASLWSSVESSYGSGAYRSGYVDDALKDLKVDNFSIQIQVQNLGGGYYRIYHNIYTY